MKLIIEIKEIAYLIERDIQATISLPGLSKGGVLQVRSEVETDNILLRREEYSNPDTPHFYADTIQRYGRLEKAVINAIREFYEKEKLTEADSCQYYPKPAEQ